MRASLEAPLGRTKSCGGESASAGKEYFDLEAVALSVFADEDAVLVVLVRAISGISCPVPRRWLRASSEQ
jgi:hypothetical protein